jgi:hypothetical protein
MSFILKGQDELERAAGIDRYIHNCDVLYIVVRAFDSPDVTHVNHFQLLCIVDILLVIRVDAVLSSSRSK